MLNTLISEMEFVINMAKEREREEANAKEHSDLSVLDVTPHSDFLYFPDMIDCPPATRDIISDLGYLHEMRKMDDEIAEKRRKGDNTLSTVEMR